MEENLIQIDDNQCTACYLCVRACPVKAIHINEDSVFPRVEDSLCIGCGICLSSCAYHAIQYKNSLNPLRELLKSGKEIVAVCDPAIAAEFSDITDYRKFVSMLRLVGFKYVMEISFGVDIISSKYAQLTQEFKGKYYITSHCPAITRYIEKYKPDLVNNLTPFISPAAAAAMTARHTYGNDLTCVVISPCIAIKKELTRYEGIAKLDLAISFKELRELFKEFHITEGKVEFDDFDPPVGYKGSLFPIPEGFLEASDINTHILEGKTVSASGEKDSLSVLQSFEEYSYIIKRNFNLFFCEGCICGPGQTNKTEKYLKYTYVADYASKRIANFDINKWEASRNKLSNSPNLNIQFHPQPEKRNLPPKEKIEEAILLLKGAGKNTHSNCGLCGFDSCTKLAIAIVQGTAVPELCVAHSIADAKKFNFALKNTDNALHDIKKKNENLEQLILTKELEIYNQNNALSALIQKLNPGVVLVNEQLKITDANQTFVDILGEDAKDISEVIPFLVGADIHSLLPNSLITQFNYALSDSDLIINRDIELEGKLINVVIFQLIENKLVGSIFRDMHSVQERPDEIISRVKEVIEENLMQVQQIGFILGEGAAKTEKMLNSIIESYK